MLTKLIGYEMKAFGRIILPLYAATIGMAIIMGVGIRVLDEDLYSNLLGAVIIMIFVSLIIATMVMTGVLCVQRFYRNLLGNEGYLMFSLPVGTHQLILAKVLSSLIWTLLGGVAGVCTVAVMGLMAIPLQDTVRLFKEISMHLRMLSLGKELGAIAVWFVIFILFFVASLMQIYTAIAVGHHGIGIIRNTLGGLVGQIGYRVGWADFLMARFEGKLFLAWQFQLVLIVSTLILIAVYSGVTWYFLDRRLNLE